MGELFRRRRPDSTLPWTGERLVTELGGEIESEHLHRYFLAREFCRGKTVLDVASGEGYGAALLAQTAQRVTGVEIDAASVLHASRAYQAPNLDYAQGSATELPLGTESVDVVVSFETLEHFFDHDLFLKEVQRVLRPGGVLIISTPNADIYSGPGSTPNPFHVRELTRSEFVERLQTTFCNVALFHQRVLSGSAIVPDPLNSTTSECWVYENRGSDTFEGHRDLPHAPYLIALASNSETALPSGVSLYVHEKPDERAELERLRKLEAAYREQEPKIRKELEAAVVARGEATRLASVVSHLQGELEGMRNVEAAYREQEPRIRQELEAASVAREELKRLKELNAAAAKQAEGSGIVSDVDHLAESLERANEQCRNQQEQLDNSVRRAREQVLVMARLQHQLTLELQNAQLLRDTIGQQESAYRELTQRFHGAEIAYQEQTDRLRRLEIAYQDQTDRLRRQEIAYEEQTQKLRDVAITCGEQTKQLGQTKATINLQERAHREQLQKLQEMEIAINRQQITNDESAKRLLVLSANLEAARTEAAQYQELSQNLAKLIIPVWVRKLVPSGLRPAARSLKRMIRPGGSEIES